MAFQQALSGLNTAGKAIDVTSHNIAKLEHGRLQGFRGALF